MIVYANRVYLLALNTSMSDCYSTRTKQLELLSQFIQTALEVIFHLKLDAIEDKIISIK